MIEEIYAQSIQEGVRESVRGSLKNGGEWRIFGDNWLPGAELDEEYEMDDMDIEEYNYGE